MLKGPFHRLRRNTDLRVILHHEVSVNRLSVLYGSISHLTLVCWLGVASLLFPAVTHVHILLGVLGFLYI